MVEGDAERNALDATTRLVAILEKLETTYIVPNGAISYRFMIPGIARQLTRMKRRDGSSKGVKEAQKKLARVATDAQDLASRIKTLLIPPEPADHPGADLKAEELSWTALGLLGVAGIIQVNNLGRLLTEFADATRTAATAKTTLAGKQGRPRTVAATEIGFYLYQEYERLTGKPPTRTTRDSQAAGAFFDLVKAVFEVLGIKAKPEPTVRRVMEKMKIQRS